MTDEMAPSLLVADDEQIVRSLFEKLLRKEGYSISFAADGRDVLSKIEKNDFDVLILDLKMPGLSGMEVLRKIKNLGKDLIIIVITGYATVDTAREAMKQGCFDYISKPFDREEIRGIIKRALDIRKMLQEKRRLEEELRIAEKLASLAQMGAGVAHEVNTVLTSVRLFLEMLKPKRHQTREGKNIALILEEIDRAEKLITRFLKFARPMKPEFVICDINKVIKKNLDFFNPILKKQKIKVFSHFASDMPQIFCDSNQMEEVFLNIFSNSIDAMPAGGELSVKSQNIGTKLLLTFEDTGMGIPKENQGKVFDPFFTTKEHGTGLGLSIVHRIIDEHRGTIDIVSREREGTSVRIELPYENDR